MEKSTSSNGKFPAAGGTAAGVVGSARLAAVAAITNYKPSSPPMNFIDTPTQELFGANVFNKSVMKARLPKSI